MATLPAAPSEAAPIPVDPAATATSAGFDALRARLSLVWVAHAVVDFFAAIIVPLLTVLEGRLALSPMQGAILLGVGSVCSGGIQPIVAALTDRFDTRKLGTIGLAVAAVAIGLVGHAESYAQLLVLQIVGTMGIGAFHPVAAAASGHLAASRRSAGVAVFFAAGMIGSIGGSLFAPFFSRRFGLPALVWTIPPGVLAALCLGWAIHSIPHRHDGAHDAHRALTAAARRARWRAIGLLYCGNALRFTVNMALVQLAVRLCEQIALREAGASVLDQALRTRASTLNGPMQAAMVIGMGAGGLGLGMILPRRHEKAALVLVPLAGALALGAIPFAGPVGMWAAVALSGLGFAGVIPLTIALAQRLLPHRTGLASGLMMGGAWMIAAVGPWLAELLRRELGLPGAFGVVAGLLAGAGLVSLALPGRVLRQSHEGGG